MDGDISRWLPLPTWHTRKPVELFTRRTNNVGDDALPTLPNDSNCAHSETPTISLTCDQTVRQILGDPKRRPLYYLLLLDDPENQDDHPATLQKFGILF